MRLKTLEIKGFKSFANETVIHFGEDVIGIVGPNGSGKSNVVDAIRWVLGEQKSRELRLEHMGNVIFNGSKKRKESGMAQVSITFDNTRNLLPTDYSSVTITRILYRSGESEYRLNGVTCRLKDITTLLLDTGIGSNSYAIIALGMVDDILHDKERARRRMFEQAAGISKYRIRKQETLSKLESATADLERVEDLLFEIEGNLKTLEKQARRTQKYFDLRDQYRELSLELAIFQLASLKQKYKDVAARLEQEENRCRQLDIQALEVETALENEKKAHLDKEKTLSERQKDLNQLVGWIRGMENDRRIKQQQIDFIAQNKQKLADQIKNAGIRISRLEEDIAEYREMLLTERRDETRLEQALGEANRHLQEVRSHHATLKSGLDDQLRAQQELERQVFELEKKKAIQASQVDNFRNDIERNLQDIDTRKGEIDALKAKVSALETDEGQQQQVIRDLESEEEKRVELIRFTEEQRDTHQREIAATRRILDARRNEYKLTKSMVDNLEGFPESIRFLSNHPEWSQRASLLSEVLYCPEPYRIAVENFLEPYLNFYIVSHLREAYEAIRLLGQSQKGKANFFLLDAFERTVLPHASVPNAVRAYEVVEVEPRFEPLIAHLLYNVWIVDEEPDHEMLSQAVAQGISLISRSGACTCRRDRLGGGSVGLFEGKKIGRKKNLEHLEADIQEKEAVEKRLSEELQKLHVQLQTLKANDLQRSLHKEKEKLNQLAQERISVQTKLENFEAFITQVHEKNAQINTFIAELEQTSRQLNLSHQEKKQASDALRDQILNADHQFREAAETLTRASTAYNEQHIAFIKQQNKVSAAQRELSFREKQLDETRTHLKQDQEQQTRNEAEHLAVTSELLDLEKKLVDSYARRKEKESLLTGAEQDYFKARGHINEQEDRLRQINRQRHDAQSLANQLKDKFNEQKFELSSLGERLRIEFKADINELINKTPDPAYQETELKDQVDKIKGRLDNYGEINPMALEAFKEMKERFDTISTQRTDILNARDSLLETITEIEETATRKFMEAFDAVRANFIEVFRSLFTQDDSCNLVLEDPANPLESAINIFAQPKGKRPQSINQLSGGEKTLTAIALLFALYLLKPAPFCIFDEVDAPLDDSNIEKFNRIIKKFSTESQFVIVTHNKATMAAVDVIYGVYMPEAGVSSVTPVDFRTLEHTSILEMV